ncbi:hypothetical protein BDQ17DRAFT_1433763 [Cyathus striatus]|nr:hypothetical protein BDQ17DRAFT_1433763 [Cyathus striatus]
MAIVKDSETLYLEFMKKPCDDPTPNFDGKPSSLHKFFKDIEMYSDENDLPDRDKISWALSHIDRTTDFLSWVDQKNEISGCHDNWDKFKQAITQLYRYSVNINDLYDLCKELESEPLSARPNLRSVRPSRADKDHSINSSAVGTHIPLMPTRHSRSAPYFNGNPHFLHRFFKDVEMLSDQCKLDDAKKVEWALEYVEMLDDYNLWRLQTGDCRDNWIQFKQSIMGLYPDASPTTRYTIDDLTSLVMESDGMPLQSLSNLSEYYRRFTLISSSLSENGMLDLEDHDFGTLFVEGMTPQFRKEFSDYLDRNRFGRRWFSFRSVEKDF